jgi:hypothetical protein
MSKLVKLFAIAALIASALAVTPGSAEAYWRRHYWGGGWGWGPGITLGWGGYPYYPYYARARPYYYAAPDCGYVRVKVWRHGHWVRRSVWRCW